MSCTLEGGNRMVQMAQAVLAGVGVRTFATVSRDRTFVGIEMALSSPWDSRKWTTRKER